jgi:hypothetical protein
VFVFRTFVEGYWETTLPEQPEPQGLGTNIVTVAPVRFAVD